MVISLSQEQAQYLHLEAKREGFDTSETLQALTQVYNANFEQDVLDTLEQLRELKEN